jgi:hypothetical protein
VIDGDWSVEEAHNDIGCPACQRHEAWQAHDLKRIHAGLPNR